MVRYKKTLMPVYAVMALLGGGYMLLYNVRLAEYAGANFLTWPASIMIYLATPLLYFGAAAFIAGFLNAGKMKGLKDAAKVLFIMSAIAVVVVALISLVSLLSKLPEGLWKVAYTLFYSNKWICAFIGALFSLSLSMVKSDIR